MNLPKYIRRLSNFVLYTFLFAQPIGMFGNTMSIQSIAPGYQDGNIVLEINTDSKAEYEISQVKNSKFELTVYNASDDVVKQSPSILWEFMPTESIEIDKKAENVLITFHLQEKSAYEIFHESAKNRIYLNITGELAKEFRQDIIRFGSEKFDQLSTEQQNPLTQILTDREFDPRNSFLIDQLKYASMNRQFGWYEKIYRQLRGRPTLTPDQLEKLAKYFESHGYLADAEKVWFDYYQRIKKTTKNKFTDQLPANSIITRADNTPKSAGAFFTSLFSNALLLDFISIIGVMGLFTGGYVLFNNKDLIRKKIPHFQVKKKAKEKENVEGDPFENFLKEIQEKSDVDIPVTPDLDTEETQKNVESAPLISKEVQQESEDRVSKKEAEESLDFMRKITDEEQIKSGNLLRQAEVVDLYNMSVEPEVIAKNLNMSCSEVELFLKISGNMPQLAEKSYEKTLKYSESHHDMSLHEMAHSMQISVEEAKLLRLKGQKERIDA